MKNFIVYAVVAILGITAMAFAKPPKKQTVTFHVSGTCGMCKDRIEQALDKPGISRAIYNVESQTATVTFNPRKLEEIQLHNLVAIAGHDTEKVKASEQAYQELPECCQYRSGAKCDH